MQIWPAIDLYGGKAVRLLRGDYQHMTIYSDDPVSVAKDFERCGAAYIHMVDLEGAKTGGTPNLHIVREVARQTGLFIEIGGGIRSEAAVAAYLEAGAGRVILGTAAVTDPDFLQRMVSAYGERIAVSVDLKDGMAAIRGWTEKSALTCDALMQRLQDAGVKTVICTDISRDGAMQGTNVALYRDLGARYAMDFIASGGVSSMADIHALKAGSVCGAIIGKAYYTGAIDLREAIEVAG
ncbi:MAG: 1-(5-phosphoribosyl)-5-[(5-phosphoribosylamino)methylideneamino]imidazole-4-carboxamide isomerase [Clostridia bacterium]|nr:1-(5-phosphoribosyl)-5-[(5-phosphoribosylamino)methylideneamino]imidazole-4-carboxamide isomerase [Clostridia bacterium]